MSFSSFHLDYGIMYTQGQGESKWPPSLPNLEKQKIKIIIKKEV